MTTDFTSINQHPQQDPVIGLSTATLHERKMSDGYTIHYRHWQSPSSTNRVLILLHGIQSHSAWYEKSCRSWANSGWHVIAPDRRGSGLNAQNRGDTPHHSRWLFDVAEFVSLAKRLGAASESNPPSSNQESSGSLIETSNNTPMPGSQTQVVLSGLSWGGRLASAYLNQWPETVSGGMLLYPGIFPRSEPKGLKRRLIFWANSLGSGNRMIKIPGLEPENFTDKYSAQQFIANDPLALKKVSLRFLKEHLEIAAFAGKGLSNPQVPIFLALAGRDRIVDSIKTKQRFLSDSSQKQPHHRIEVYESAAHTLEFDDCHQTFLQHTSEWLENVFPAPRLRIA